ncbi:hypothetical protein OAO01_00340 [Oligoflexia bacterium]|nr:hypothetical protein [Oligoflexia bacterium]
MRKNLCIFIILGLLLGGCSATQELTKAREVIENRTVSYSPLSGNSYRTPPKEQSTAPAAPGLPEGTVLSYSPVSGKWTTVRVNRPRRMKAATPKSSRSTWNLGASYSPLTGETTTLTR